MPDQLPDNVEGWVELSEQFLQNARDPEGNPVLELSDEKLNAHRDELRRVQALIARRNALKNELSSVRRALKAEGRALETRTRRHLRVAFYSDASPAQKRGARVSAPVKAVRRAPRTPGQLLATPALTGQVLLKWKRTGNGYTTTFVVEKRLPGHHEWRIAAIVTTTKVRVECPVGQHTLFRVTARNSQGDSEPSQPISVYNG